jgi:hypothetical protein
MEMSFTELEQDDHTNYWTNESTNNNIKSKKNVSYDDILSSLNMVVHNGVLQFAKPAPEKLQHQLSQKQHQHQHQQQQQQQQQHSYIHNKYFQTQQIQPERRPMTREEYIRDYNARLASQRRIAQIKSKKLLFDTQHIHFSPAQNPRDMNKLFVTRFNM